MRLLHGLVRIGLAALVGAVSGAAGTLLHQQWWGMVLALGTGLVVLAWLPPGGVRLAFALGWVVAVLRGVLQLTAGGFLIGSDAPGWSFVAGSGVLLVAALATLQSGLRTGRERADDHGYRESSS